MNIASTMNKENTMEDYIHQDDIMNEQSINLKNPISFELKGRLDSREIISRDSLASLKIEHVNSINYH